MRLPSAPLHGQMTLEHRRLWCRGAVRVNARPESAVRTRTNATPVAGEDAWPTPPSPVGRSADKGRGVGSRSSRDPHAGGPPGRRARRRWRRHVRGSRGGKGLAGQPPLGRRGRSRSRKRSRPSPSCPTGGPSEALRTRVAGVFALVGTAISPNNVLRRWIDPACDALGLTTTGRSSSRAAESPSAQSVTVPSSEVATSPGRSRQPSPRGA
jgi:hypothetical protein